MHTIAGEPLAPVPRIAIAPGGSPQPGAYWTLKGVTSNERYVIREEKHDLTAVQQGIGRTEATQGAIIPIRKNVAWWSLSQDERRSIVEDKSQHIKTGLKYLPAIARRLHHCRDLEQQEAFDFVTLFDYAPEHANAFEDLVNQLRATEEWSWVDREVDIRMVRVPVSAHK
jgi:chlorite dismutase